MKIAGTVPGPYTTYVPKPRQRLFHSIRPLGPKLIKGAVGGLGGGKSTCCEQELVELCLRQPGGNSVAVRKSISNRAELSVLKDLRDMLLPGGHAGRRRPRLMLRQFEAHDMAADPNVGQPQGRLPDQMAIQQHRRALRS